MISPGVLNRLRGSVKFNDYASLNVSASYLAKEGIGLTFQGDIVDSFEAMAGVVQSPQPYILAIADISLVRSQSLATQFKTQWELNALLGDMKLYTDSSTFGDFSLYNVAIASVKDMKFAGGEPGVIVSLKGTYFVNSSMWDS
jgi:hypothetical protein